MCTINEDHVIYGSWNIRCDRHKISTFWAIFCPFSPLTTWKIKILKKTPGDIIILHISTKNDNHMMYGSWDMEHDRQFFVIPDHFLPFYPTMDPQNQNFQKNEKKKNTWRYYHLTNISDSHMMYGSSNMECNGQKFLSFWTVFCPFTPLTTRKITIWKNERKKNT